MRHILLLMVLSLPACSGQAPVEEGQIGEVDPTVAESADLASTAPEGADELTESSEPAAEQIAEVTPTVGRFDGLGTLAVANHRTTSVGDLHAVRIDEAGPSMEEKHKPTFSFTRAQELKAVGALEEAAR